MAHFIAAPRVERAGSVFIFSIAVAAFSLFVAAPAGAQGPPTITWQGTHSGLANAVAFSPDGQLVASGSADKTTRVWRASDGALLATLVQCSGIGCRGASSVAFSPDGQLLATSGSNMKLWSTADFSLVRTISSGIASIRFSPDGQRILGTGAGSGYNTQFVREIRVADGVILRNLSGGGVASAYSPDGTRIAAVGRHGFDLWDAATGQLLRHLTGARGALAFAPEGDVIAVAGNGLGDYRYDDTIAFYRVDDGSVARVFERTGAVTSMVFTADGSRLVTGSWDPNEDFVTGFLDSTGVLRFWDLADGTPHAAYDAETGTAAKSPAVSPNGQRFAYTHDAKVVVAPFPSMSCPAALAPDRVLVPSGGGSGTFDVIVPEGCAWTATSRVAWLHVTGGGSGNGPGTVTFSVDSAAQGAADGGYDGIVGQITAAGRSFLVDFGAPGDGCYFILQPDHAEFTPAGGDSGVSVSSPAGCAWQAHDSAPWIHASADIHVSDGGILYHVDPSGPTGGVAGETAPRTGTFRIGDSTFTVTQQ